MISIVLLDIKNDNCQFLLVYFFRKINIHSPILTKHIAMSILKIDFEDNIGNL